MSTGAVILVIWVAAFGALIGVAIGASLGHFVGRDARQDPDDQRTSRITTVWFICVLSGAILGAVVGWLLGAWLADSATSGCQEMDCLSGLLWIAGGEFFGAMIGAAIGVVTARFVSTGPRSLQPEGS
jgi:MFS family permease